MQMNILMVSYSQAHRGEVEDQKIDPARRGDAKDVNVTVKTSKRWSKKEKKRFTRMASTPENAEMRRVEDPCLIVMRYSTPRQLEAQGTWIRECPQLRAKSVSEVCLWPAIWLWFRSLIGRHMVTRDTR
jgi:hypothetical protein